MPFLQFSLLVCSSPRVGGNVISRGLGVYLGKNELLVAGVRIYPLQEFLKRLWAGEVLVQS
jgi:hypothetical protein